jgi:ribosome recycling factor
VKVVQRVAGEGKVAIRNVRAATSCRSEGARRTATSATTRSAGQSSRQKITDDHTKSIDDLG